MKRAWRWLKRIVLGTLALVVVAVIAALIVVHTDWGRNLIRKQIEAALLQNFPGGAKVGKLEGSVFGTLVVTDIVLSDLDHTPMVKVGSVKLELALLPLFLKTAHIDSLLVEDVVVTKHKQTLTAPPPPPPGSMTVEIPTLEVRRISAAIETPQGPLTIDDGSATASVNILPGGFVKATANVKAMWRERAAPITAVVGVVVGNGVTIPFARAAVGGVEVVANAVDVDALSGTVSINGSRAAIAQLVPGIDLPGDVNLRVTTATRTPEGLHVVLAGSVGGASIDGAAFANILTGSARGVIGVHNADLGTLSKGHVNGHGNVVIAAVIDGLRVRGTAIASGAITLPEGELTGEPANSTAAVTTKGTPSRAISGQVIVAVDGTLNHASVLLIGTGPGDSRIAVIGGVKDWATKLVIEPTLVGASTLDPHKASGGLAPVTGAIDIDGSVEGPSDALVIAGTLNGSRIAFEDKRVGRLGARFALTIKPGPKQGREVLGTAHAEITNVVNAGSGIGSFTVDAKSRTGGKLTVSGQARLAMAPVIVDAEALITLGDVIDIALGPHRVRTEKGELRGDGGSVHIGEQEIIVQGIHTAPVGSGKGSITVDATIGKLTKDVVAALAVRDIPASLIDPAYRGSASADLAITRKRMKWSGGGNVVVRGFAIAADTLEIDAEAKVNVADRRVTVEGHVANKVVGGARVALEVDGPKDLTDGAAWMRVKRGDLRQITIGIERLDLAALTDKKTAGIADGTLVITAGVPSGSLTVRDVPTPAGMVNADVTLSLTDVGFVDLIAKAKVGTLGGADAEIRLQIPERVFDPVAWKALGTTVVHRATVRTTDVAFDERLLAQLGVDAPYSGKATAEIIVGAGGSSVDVTATVRNVKGGLIKRGIDVAVTARVDDKGTGATLRATSGTLTFLDLPDARSPVTLDQWIAKPKAGLSSPISGTLTMPRVPARDLLAILGRIDVLGGSAEAKVAIAGTIAAPTAVATVDLLAIKVKPRLVSKPPPMLTAMHINATWDGKLAELHVKGTEENKGTLEIDASARPAQLKSATAKLKITNFDLAPIVVFLPGQLVGARGKIEADLTIKRLDPSLGSVLGFVHLIEGRLPISPVVGTLRAADVKIDLDDGGVTVKLDGKVGGGTIKLEVTTTDLVRAKLFADVTKFQPIIALAPIISGRVTGDFERRGMTWHGAAKISRASVLIPEEQGNVLLDATVPEDLIFVDRPVPLPKRLARAPERPYLVANIEIEPVRVTMPKLELVAAASGQVEVSVGETIGLVGQIGVDSGTLVIASHRYRVEIGQVAFDGTTDALIDVKLAHDFPDVTTYVNVATRISGIDSVEPQFTSEPGIYTQGQLLGFFVGGEPGGDPSKQTSEAAVGLGASLLSGVLGKRLKRIKVIGPLLEGVTGGCKPGAGQSSASCGAGKWVSKKTYVSFEKRIDARLDENSGEGKVEYYWKPNRTLELTGGDRGFFGLDLLWRHRW